LPFRQTVFAISFVAFSESRSRCVCGRVLASLRATTAHTHGTKTHRPQLKASQKTTPKAAFRDGDGGTAFTSNPRCWSYPLLGLRSGLERPQPQRARPHARTSPASAKRADTPDARRHERPEIASLAFSLILPNDSIGQAVTAICAPAFVSITCSPYADGRTPHPISSSCAALSRSLSL
jgi:hypothetical protein